MSKTKPDPFKVYDPVVGWIRVTDNRLLLPPGKRYWLEHFDRPRVRKDKRQTDTALRWLRS